MKCNSFLWNFINHIYSQYWMVNWYVLNLVHFWTRRGDQIWHTTLYKYSMLKLEYFFSNIELFRCWLVLGSLLVNPITLKTCWNGSYTLYLHQKHVLAKYGKEFHYLTLIYTYNRDEGLILVEPPCTANLSPATIILI